PANWTNGESVTASVAGSSDRTAAAATARPRQSRRVGPVVFAAQRRGPSQSLRRLAAPPPREPAVGNRGTPAGCAVSLLLCAPRFQSFGRPLQLQSRSGGDLVARPRIASLPPGI